MLSLYYKINKQLIEMKKNKLYKYLSFNQLETTQTSTVKSIKKNIHFDTFHKSNSSLHLDAYSCKINSLFSYREKSTLATTSRTKLSITDKWLKPCKSESNYKKLGEDITKSFKLSQRFHSSLGKYIPT